MPEEINRVATDHISDLLLAPTQNAMELLGKEGLAEKAVFTGDVMYDSILFYSDLLNETHRPESLNGLADFYLSTIHRPENTDNPQRLQSIFSAFSEADLPVVLPLHPRTKQRLKGIRYNDNVRLIEPVGYLQMIYLLRHSKKVLTDSGGLQKEAYFLRKPCITLRDQTEWIETLDGNWNFIVAADKDKILSHLQVSEFGPIQKAYGDGHAAENIISAISRAQEGN
jgi:UDP-GlcNAc3NAcA epimerase